MHPYESLPDVHFWSRSVSSRDVAAIDVDAAPRWKFALDRDVFATAGSCFAQHFGRELAARGGRLFAAEERHPLVPEQAGHGYGVFPARYGNLYCTTQLKDLFEQARGLRPPILEFAQRPDGRWVDMLRPRAIPDGFSSEADARADRLYHLARVRAMMHECTVFVFTLGLTESWVNVAGGYAYGLCPGVAGGQYDAGAHAFHNMGFADCLADLNAAIACLQAQNPAVRILLTVSPVNLVATMEARGALQSSVASKSILRAVADACVRQHANVDYFPSYEIIAGPQARGQFYSADGREVTPAGVKLVMESFFRSRVTGNAVAAPVTNVNWQSQSAAIAGALQADCDEVLLDQRPPVR